MTLSEKIKTIDNKIEQIKARYNLDRYTTKTFALSSKNFGKYEFLTDEDVLLGKNLLEKDLNQKIQIFTIMKWVEKANWHCK